MLDVIFKYAAGDLTARGALLEDSSSLDGVMSGINILGEELEAYVAENDQANKSLRQALDLAQALIRSSPDGIVAIDRDLRITEWNLVMEEITGLSMEQARGRGLDEIPFLDCLGATSTISEARGTTDVDMVEVEFESPGTDQKRLFESIMAPLAEQTEETRGAVLILHDITERKRAEEQLRSASLYARSLIEASLDPLLTVTVGGEIMDVNEAAARGTGVPREQLVGSDFSTYFTDPADARSGYEEAFANRSVMNRPLTMRHVSGKMTEVLFNASLYRDEKDGVAGVLIVARDITEQRRAEEASELARRDSLTDLYNHRTFYSLLNDEIVRAQRYNHPVSLLMLDIDHFKRVNDIHGHQAGDAILKDLSDLLVKRARSVDYVCRYGGEEFTIILPETDATHAMRIAERLRTDVECKPSEIGGGRTIGITVSIGVATYPQQVNSLETLVKASDDALYAAKRGGRNRCVGNG
jgi:diguanylate cyclase (GGDEF)-like protein/PAS domain S-box-containing protein